MSNFKPDYSSLIFNETFDSVKSVSDNGGTIGAGVTISNGIATFSGANGAKIQYLHPISPNNVTDFSVRIRIKADVTSGNDGIFTLGAYNGAGEFEVVLINNTISKRANGGEIGSATAFTSNNWVNITMVYDGTDFLLYVDDSLEQQDNSSAMDFNNAKLTIGSYNSDPYTFDGQMEYVQVYKKALNAAEIADLNENDTFSELDASQAKIYLPLRSWYYKASGSELLTDGDMEAAGVGDWTALRATLTKETSSPHGGTNWLKVLEDGSGNPFASQAILTVGLRYRARGWARSDGTYAPKVGDYAGAWWGGTTSTSWQYFDVVATSAHANFAFYNLAAAASGGYSGFDDVSVELMEAKTDNSGSLGGTVDLGDKSTTTTFPTQLSPHGMSFDGGDYLNLGTSINSYLLHDQAFSLVFSGSSVKAGGYHHILSSKDAVPRGIDIQFTDGQGVRMEIYDGANYILKYHNLLDVAHTGVFTVTYDGSETTAGIKCYFDGKLVAGAEGNSGTFSSTTPSGDINIGRQPTGANYLASGTKINTLAFYDFELTASQAKYLSWKLHNEYNI